MHCGVHTSVHCTPYMQVTPLSTEEYLINPLILAIYTVYSEYGCRSQETNNNLTSFSPLHCLNKQYKHVLCSLDKWTSHWLDLGNQQANPEPLFRISRSNIPHTSRRPWGKRSLEYLQLAATPKATVTLAIRWRSDSRVFCRCLAIKKEKRSFSSVHGNPLCPNLAFE